MNPTLKFGDVGVLRPQDQVLLDIITTNQWERPIYWAATTADDSKLELYNYLQMEGMAFRLVPDKQLQGDNSVNYDIMWKQLMRDTLEYSKDFLPGFRFRGMDDPTVFKDDNHIRMAQNYRNAYIRLALYCYNELNDTEKTIAVLKKMDKNLPRSTVRMDYRIEHDIAKLLYVLGDMEDYISYANEIIQAAEKVIEKKSNRLFW